MSRIAALALLASPFAFVPAGSGGPTNVFVVDPLNAPGASFTDLQLAIDSVPAESVLILRGEPGTEDYPVAYFVEKPLIIIGEPDAEVDHLFVRNVDAAPVVVSRLELMNLEISGCEALIVAEELHVTSFDGVEITNSDNVQLRRAVIERGLEIRGSQVEILDSEVKRGTSNGSPGIDVYGRSRVTLTRTSSRGTNGYSASCIFGDDFGSDGGPGVRLFGGTLSVRGLPEDLLDGGSGGYTCPDDEVGFEPGFYNDDGEAVLVVNSTAPKKVLLSGDVTLDPQPPVGPPFFRTPVRQPGLLVTPVTNLLVEYQAHGEPGAAATLYVDDAPFTIAPTGGSFSLPFGGGGPKVYPMGELDADGLATLTLPFGVEPGALLYARTAVTLPGGSATSGRLSNPVAFLAPFDSSGLPVACLIAPTSPVATGTAAVLDASNSTVPNETIVDYLWDFGDGTLGSGPTPTHTWSAAGNYTVALISTDSAGEQHACSTTQIVSDAPVCGFATSSSNLALTLDASASFDPDGGIATYTWELGDGTVTTTATPVLNHAYQAEGLYDVTLTLTDSSGVTSSCTTQVDMQSIIPPTCTIDAQPTGFPLIYSFNGAGSVDPDGTIVGYAWDFGDGSAAFAPITFHAYAAPGTYTVTLTLTDDEGLSSTCSTQITL